MSLGWRPQGFSFPFPLPPHPESMFWEPGEEEGGRVAHRGTQRNTPLPKPPASVFLRAAPLAHSAQCGRGGNPVQRMIRGGEIQSLPPCCREQKALASLRALRWLPLTAAQSCPRLLLCPATSGVRTVTASLTSTGWTSPCTLLSPPFPDGFTGVADSSDSRSRH